MAAIHCGDATMVRDMWALGYDVCSLASDVDYMLHGAGLLTSAALTSGGGSISSPVGQQNTGLGVGTPPVIEAPRLGGERAHNGATAPAEARNRPPVSTTPPPSEAHQDNQPDGGPATVVEQQAWADALDAFEAQFDDDIHVGSTVPTPPWQS